MLDLAQVLGLIEDGLNQRSASQEGLVKCAVLNRLHVLAYLRGELHLLLAQSLDQQLGDIALVGINPAKQVAAQLRDRFAVIDIAGFNLIS